MGIRIKQSDVIWGYLGCAFKYGANLLILPMILKTLGTEEIGIWYVFVSIGGIAALLDFGFAPTITRYVSYAWAGADEIKEDFAGMEIKSDVNWDLMANLLFTSQKIYLYISCIAFFLTVGVGTFYIHDLSGGLSNQNEVMIAWLIYSLGLFFNLYYSYWIPFLNGIGQIGNSQKATIISNGVYLIIAFIGLQTGYGLQSMGAAFLFSGLFLRLLAKRYFCLSIAQEKIRTTNHKGLFKLIWRTAYKSGLVAVGGYLLVNANTLICSKYIGLKATASYGLSLQLFSVLSGFATIYLFTCLPLLNEARLKNDTAKLVKYFSESALIAWTIFLLGGILIILGGDMVFDFIGSKTKLLPRGTLTFMFAYLFLEFNHGSIFATFITTKNEIPFVVPALLSGSFAVVFSLLLVNFTQLGLWSLMISQTVVQLSYNNWKWPYTVLKELDLSLFAIIKTGTKELKDRMDHLFGDRARG